MTTEIKKKINMTQRCKHKTQNYKTPKENLRENLHDLGFSHGVLDVKSRGQSRETELPQN